MEIRIIVAWILVTLLALIAIAAVMVVARARRDYRRLRR